VCDLGFCLVCTSTAGCSAPTPACDPTASGGLGACFQCLSSFDCTTPATPICDTTARVCIPATPPVAGDTCANPIPITLATLPDGGTGADLAFDSTTAHNLYAPSSTGTCGYGADGKELVYELTLGAAKNLSVTSTGVGLADPVIYLRTSPCETGPELACSDVSYGGGTESFSLGSLAAGTYYLFVDDYAPDAGGQQSVHLDVFSPPPGDSCANPIPVPFTDGGTFRINLADFSHHETSATAGTCGSPTGPDIVYSLTTSAPRSLKVVATPVQPADGGTTLNDPYIFVRAAPCATGAELICADDGWGNTVETLPTDGGVYGLGTGTYFIIVGDWNYPPDPTDLSVTVGP